jgi:hypothetical protein
VVVGGGGSNLPQLVDGETAILPLSSDSEAVAAELLLGENPGIPPAELPQFEVRARGGVVSHAPHRARRSGRHSATVRNVALRGRVL